MNWQTVELGQIATVDYGVTASAISEPTGPKFLRITNIQDGAVDWKRVPYCHCSDRERTSARLRAGDIVFARTGATTGKSFLIRDEPDDAVFASYLIRVQPSKKILSAFLAHFFNSPGYWSQIAKHARGAGQPGVNATSLKSLKVPLPPLDEQRRIAAILDKAEELRRKRRAAISLLDQLPQAIFLEMFGDPVTNPMDWPIGELKDVSVQITDGEHLTPRRSQTGVKLLSARNVQDGYLDFGAVDFVDAEEHARISKRCNPKRGDLLISCSGTIGRVAQVAVDEPLSLVRSAALVKLDQSKVTSTFVELLLRTPSSQRRMQQRANASSQANLFQNQIRELPVIVPPLPLQIHFSGRVEANHCTKAAHHSALSELDSLFASLQAQAFGVHYG